MPLTLKRLCATAIERCFRGMCPTATHRQRKPQHNVVGCRRSPGREPLAVGSQAEVEGPEAGAGPRAAARRTLIQVAPHSRSAPQRNATLGGGPGIPIIPCALLPIRTFVCQTVNWGSSCDPRRSPSGCIGGGGKYLSKKSRDMRLGIRILAFHGKKFRLRTTGLSHSPLGRSTKGRERPNALMVPWGPSGCSGG